MNKDVLAAGLAAALVLAAGAAQAGSVSIQLGASNENFVLYGQGPVAPGVGSFTIQQGSESYNPVTNTTTDTLTGAISGSSRAGLSSGDYAFITSYTGMPIGDGGFEIQGQSNPAALNQFFYSSFDPSVSMTLKLTGTPDGSFTLPLVTGGLFDGPNFSFAYTNGTCTGPVPTCGQNEVGLTPGSSIFAPVTIFVQYTAVPEPAEWALMLLGFGGLGAALRLRKRVAAA